MAAAYTAGGTRREQEPPHHAVAGRELRVILELAAQPPGLAFGLDAIARHQPHFGGEVVHRDDQEIVDAVVGDPAPRHPADVARDDQRAR